MTDVERPAKICLHVRLPLVRRAFVFHGAGVEVRTCDSRVADEHVYPPVEEVCGFFDSGADFFDLAEIGDAVADARGVGGEVGFCAVLEFFGANVEDVNFMVGRLGEEVAGCGAAYALSSACEEDVLLFLCLRHVDRGGSCGVVPGNGVGCLGDSGEDSR